MLHDTIARLSGNLLGVSPENAYCGIETALRTLGKALPAERTSLYLISQEGDRFDRVQQWQSCEIAAQGLAETSLERWNLVELPWLAEQLAKQEPFCIGSVSGLGEEARAERLAWSASGLGSAIFIPMVSGGVLMGALQVESLGRERQWPEESLPLLRIAVDAMASLLGRQRTDESLRASRARLKESEQFCTMGRMAGGIAHDFNNFLTAIIGYSEVLSSGLDETSPCQEDVAEIRHAADRASVLVEKILRVGSRRHDPKKLDPSEAVGELTKILRRIAGQGIKLETDLAEAPAHVLMDPSTSTSCSSTSPPTHATPCRKAAACASPPRQWR